ncbi:MAG TPA: cbb3-type cytochrome c oxidase subunit II [Verrucomicrobiae bacterium]|nr:cbb3-type cytochrome c oxidase subunit II [Verrucomicrobiae bacterium]
MNYGALIFLAAFVGISASWFGFVMTPQLQLGNARQGTNTVNTAQLYPLARPGLAQEGLQVYRENGCVYCHSQQVGQTGTEVNYILTEAGTNAAAVAEALLNARLGLTNANAAGLVAGLPKPVLRNVNIASAKKAAKAAREAGGQGQVEIVPVGSDIERGWGKRRSVAQDYLYDYPVMLGSHRIGPDLANVGTRLPDPMWHYRHLYAPRTVVPDSAMPSYRFLFEQRKLNPGQPIPEESIALNAEGGLHDPAKDSAAPASVLIPKPEARALVAYLISLQASAPLFEVPLSAAEAPAAPVATNAPPPAQ